MNPTTLTKVLDLFKARELPSRNREFEQFRDGEGRQVLRLFRLYHHLREDLLEAAHRPEVRVEGHVVAGGLLITVMDPVLSLRRECLVPHGLTGSFRAALRNLAMEHLLELKAEAAQDPNEILPVVDEEDREIGRATRAEIHRHGLLHRSVSVLFFDEAGRVYLQLRSPHKDTHPCKWTTSASGHVDPNETYLAAARRELREELGICAEADHLVYVGRLRAGPETEGEFMAVFMLVGRQEPQPNPVETQGGRFMTWSQAMAIARNPDQAAPSLKLVLELYQATI